MASPKKYLVREFPLIRPYEIGERERVIEGVPKGHVLLKMIVAGICGSDILYFKGYKEKWKLEERLPICLLHEGVAEVVDIGDGVSLKPGERVVIMPLMECRECIACKMNLGENMCLKPRFLASTSDGLARTHLIYPANRVIPISGELDLRIAILTEPLSVVLNAIETAGLSGNEDLAIIGDGVLGYLLALTIKHLFNAPRVRLHVLGIVEEKLAVFTDIADTINVLKDSNRLRDLKDGLDLVFEAVGGKAHEKTLAQGLELLRPAGMLIILGIPGEEKTPVRVQDIVRKNLIVRGSFWSRMNHFKKALYMLEDEVFQRNVEKILSKTSFKIRSPEDLEKALRYADSEEGVANRIPGKVLVYFDDKC